MNAYADQFNASSWRWMPRRMMLSVLLVASCFAATSISAVAESQPVGVASRPAAGNEVAVRNDEIGPPLHLSGLITSLTIFVLAIFVGFEVITKVPPTLHTPLMSGSNAISGITLVGALVAAGAKHGGLAAVLGMIAVALATINVVGGFLVTHRMLEMFRKKKAKQ
jgi:NAD(P) transhydrogenase subunit alpha